MTAISFPAAKLARKSGASSDAQAFLADIEAATEIISAAKAEIEALSVLNYWKINQALADALAAVEEARSLSDR